MVVRVFIALLFTTPLLFAEITVETITGITAVVEEVESGLNNTVYLDAGGEVSFSSVSPAVRTQLRLKLSALGRVFQDHYEQTLFTLSLPQAYITFRLLPSRMRLSMGKAPLSWGDGVFYNAADTVHGSRVLTGDFSSAVLRDQSVWLLSYFLPLGRFSFLEAMFGYPRFDIGMRAVLPSDAPASSSIALSGLQADGYVGGGRIQTKALGIKWEFSYLYRSAGKIYEGRGERSMHHFPAVSLQGHLGIDWYLSLVYPLPNSLENFHPDTSEISLGLLYTRPFSNFKSLGLRLESLFQLREMDLYLFPEVIITPDDLWSLYIRSEWKVLHSDAVIIVGARVAPYTGISLDPFASLRIVDEQFSSFAIGLHMRYIF